MEQMGIDLFSQHQMGKFSSWEIQEAPIVTKCCDKSFFDYKGATIPQELYWFFGVDDRLEKSKAMIKLIYNGETFSGHVSKSVAGLKTNPGGGKLTVRVFWEDKLSNLFNKLRDVPGLTAVFQKPLHGEENLYYMSFRTPADGKSGRRSWLLTWNPNKFYWEDYNYFVRETQAGNPVDFSWSCSSTHVEAGDRVYLMMLGTKENGIIASGTATGVSEEDVHWDDNMADEGKTQRYLDVSLDFVADRLTQKYLPIQKLNELYPNQKWNPMSSGISIKEEYWEDLEELWNKTVEEIKSGKGEEPEDTDIPVKDALDHIKQYITAAGFYYEDQMIDNFYLSLKSKPFVLLAGISGTGKTRLTRLFAQAIGAEYRMVPVRPDWSDSTDLFGHVGLNGAFVPGAVLDFIHEAIQNPQKPYILCLDEMNLARVEYYLSDILSVIETREFSNGRIVSAPLIAATLYGPDADARETWGEMGFPENLYIVGTVNMDETTFPFSRKVLDRANTIEFSYVDLRTSQKEPGEAVQPLQMSNAFLRTDYLFLDQCGAEMDVVEKYTAQLQEVNAILREANAHVGYRARDEIVFYLLNNRKNDLMPETDAMDHEIMQKILPRISGSSGVVRDMLCDLFKYCAGDYNGYQIEAEGMSAKMLRAAEEPNCRYPRSAKKIAYMMGRLEDDGFTSYWL